MTQQEQFEADYLAAFPYRGATETFLKKEVAQQVWQQQAARHAAEIAELVRTLKPLASLLQEHNSRGQGSQPIFGINDATIYLGDLRAAASVIAKYEVKS